MHNDSLWCGALCSCPSSQGIVKWSTFLKALHLCTFVIDKASKAYIMKKVPIVSHGSWLSTMNYEL